MTLRRARTDADELRSVRDGSASFDEGGEDVRLALRRTRRECAAQVSVPHAKSLATAANHSPRPSIGMP